MVTTGKWVLWLRWLSALALILALACLAGEFRSSPPAFWLFVTAIVAIPWFYKPIKQRIELVIDGQPVSLRLEINLLGRIRWRWQSKAASSAETLGGARPLYRAGRARLC
jgi:hypothetical protein